MWDIRGEVLKAARALDIGLRELSPDERRRVRDLVGPKYAHRGRADHWIWNDLLDAVSARDDETWRWIGEFVADRPAILFFNSDAEKAMFAVDSGPALVAILGEIYYDEFYVTDEAGDYLLCYDHHDIL